MAQVRQCQGEWLAAGAEKSVSCDDFLQQMGYREYSRYLAFHFPFIHERSLLRHLRACPWRIDQAAFKVRPGQLLCTLLAPRMDCKAIAMRASTVHTVPHAPDTRHTSATVLT